MNEVNAHNPVSKTSKNLAKKNKKKGSKWTINDKAYGNIARKK
tara:strand:+ start:373 stop:501 length:129 start_codon:yes stop_codon:yes gene_type:complete